MLCLVEHFASFPLNQFNGFIIEMNKLHCDIKNNLACVSSEDSDQHWHLPNLIIDLLFIMRTCPCNVNSLTPNFYKVKLGFTEVYFIFLFLL